MEGTTDYEVQELLGAGGFGAVYRVKLTEPHGLDRQVAVKVLLGHDGARSERRMKRLRDEARMLGLLHHPVIVRADTLTQIDGAWALVMEYVDGVDLNELIRTDVIPARVLLEVVEQVASALASAWGDPALHGKPLRLVHRDIKLSNIRITRRGEVKLLDFGVARAEFESRESRTTFGRMGTRAYMAPERHFGVDDHEGDVFSLGVVLASCLTRRRFDPPPTSPVKFTSYLATIYRAVHNAYKTYQARGMDVPTDVQDELIVLLEQMLTYDHAERPGAHEVTQRLRTIADHMRGPTLRAWAEDYVPMTQRRAQVNAQVDSGPMLLPMSGTLGTHATTHPRPRRQPLRTTPALFVVGGVAAIFAALAVVFAVVSLLLFGVAR